VTLPQATDSCVSLASQRIESDTVCDHMSMQGDPFKDVVDRAARILDRFDTLDLLRSIAGLQLMPENADRFIRLETLANILAALPHEQSRPIATRHRLSQICNSAPVANSFVASLEDPFETLFTESFTFFGGSFLVFPGNDLAATHNLNSLARGLFSRHWQRPPADFLQAVYEAVSVILCISDETAKRCGLTRGMAPIGATRDGVVIPGNENLERLRGGVA